MHSFVKGNLVRRVNTDFGSMKIGDTLEVVEVSPYGLYFDNDINHYDSSNFELVKEDEIMVETQKKHVHADTIKAWADGAKIERRLGGFDDWTDDTYPTWDKRHFYRIKSEIKEDIVCKIHINKLGYTNSNSPNLLLIFDGETGKLKSAEVIKD